MSLFSHKKKLFLCLSIIIFKFAAYNQIPTNRKAGVVLIIIVLYTYNSVIYTNSTITIMVKIIMLIFLHLIGDSVLQSQKLRQQKIDSVLYLFKHVGIYSIVFLIFIPILLQLTLLQTFWFTLINVVIHFGEDWIFVKIKKHYWDNKDYKFVAAFSIVEHLLHVTILILTFMIMFPGSIDMSTWFNDFMVLVQSR